jgi:hypothetical protein
MKRKDFVQIFCCCKTVLNIVWIRSRNQNFSKVGTGNGTGTTINNYGSTILHKTVYRFLFPN